MEGFGFKKSDDLAFRLGFPENDRLRLKEAIRYTLNVVCYQQGYTFLTSTQLLNSSFTLLKNNPLILGEETEGMTLATFHSLKACNINLSHVPTFHSNSPLLMTTLLESKDGIGFLYEDYIELFSNVKKMDLINFKASQGIYLLYSQNSFDQTTLKELLKVLKKWKEK